MLSFKIEGFLKKKTTLDKNRSFFVYVAISQGKPALITGYYHSGKNYINLKRIVNLFLLVPLYF